MSLGSTMHTGEHMFELREECLHECGFNDEAGVGACVS